MTWIICEIQYDNLNKYIVWYFQIYKKSQKTNLNKNYSKGGKWHDKKIEIICLIKKSYELAKWFHIGNIQDFLNTIQETHWKMVFRLECKEISFSKWKAKYG